MLHFRNGPPMRESHGLSKSALEGILRAGQSVSEQPVYR